MTERSPGTVSALVRGLRVLAALNDLTNGSVGDLSRVSGVAKTTVLRILRTLVAEGYVALDEPTQIYRVTDKVADLSRGLIGADQQVRTIQPILDGLSDLRWPVEFLVAEGLDMVIQQNNRAKAPIKLSLFERRRFSILQSAAGMAYLAALGDKARGPLMRAAAEADPASTDTSLRTARRWLKQTIDNGFAERDLTELATGTRAIAVPVGESEPMGALVMILFRDMITTGDLKRNILPRLRAAAADIQAATSGRTADIGRN